jgi:hypothetical protein
VKRSWTTGKALPSGAPAWREQIHGHLRELDELQENRMRDEMPPLDERRDRGDPDLRLARWLAAAWLLILVILAAVLRH